MSPRASEPQSGEIAALSAEVHRLLSLYPETANWVWITLLIFNFLLIIPVVFAAVYVCILLKVNATVGLVFGVAAWLGIFMFWRQCMFWRRLARVNAFVREFNAAFPMSPSRDAALTCLRAVKSEENEVLVLAKERLLGQVATRRPGVLVLGETPQAGAGLAGTNDPRIDSQVGDLLSALNQRLVVLNWVQAIVGLGLPLAFFVLAGIEDPKAKGGELIWGTLVILAVWNGILAFILGFVETPIVGKATQRFNELFPEGSADRAIALAAFTRVVGCNKAKTALRESFSEDAGDEDDDKDEEQSQPVHPAGRQRHAHPPPAAAPSAAPPVLIAPQPPVAAPAIADEPQAVAATPPSTPVRGARIELEPFAAPAPTPAPAATPAPLPAMALEPAGAVAPQPAAGPAKAQARSHFCTQCGQPLAANVQFCTHCGAKAT